MKNFEVICTSHFGIGAPSKNVRVKHIYEQSIYTVVREEKIHAEEIVYVIKIDPINEKKFTSKRFDKLTKGYNKKYEKVFYGKINAANFAKYLGVFFNGGRNERFFVHYTTEKLYEAYKKHGVNYPEYLKILKKQKKKHDS